MTNVELPPNLMNGGHCSAERLCDGCVDITLNAIGMYPGKKIIDHVYAVAGFGGHCASFPPVVI